MTALALALRALWWRRGVSLVVLAIAAFVAAAAAAGPIYLRAAGESILQDTLRSAPPTATGVEVRVQGPAIPGRLGRLADAVRAARQGIPAYDQQVGALELEVPIVATDGSVLATTRLAYRDQMCEHVTLVEGRCPAVLGDAAVSEDALNARGWNLGQVLVARGLQTEAGPRELRITAVYRPEDPLDSYWFSRSYFVSTGVSAGADDDRMDAILVPEVTFSGLTPETPVRTVVDVLLDRAQVDVRTAGTVVRGVTRLRDALRRTDSDASVDAPLASSIALANQGRDALEIPVLLIVLQLLVLSWFVLFMVVASSAEARAGEIALAKTRGLAPVATVAFGLLESLLLLVASIPLGLLLSTAGVRVLASSELLPDTPVRLVPLAVGAAAVAALGGLVAAALAASRTLRTPVLDLWRRASSGRQGGRRSLAADAAVLTLAGAGLLQLWLGGALRQGDAAQPDIVALLAPGLLSLGVALVGARLLPVLCRAAFAGTRGSRWIGLFLGLRQVARRPSGLRVVVILTIAFGLATFSILGWSVLAANRADRARAETGADRALAVELDAGADLLTAVRQADPGGRHAMAVVVPDTSTVEQLVGVDSERFAAVGFWRGDFSSGHVADIARRLRPAAPEPVLVRGDAMGLRVSVTRLAVTGLVTLEVDLQLPDGQRETAELGPVAVGPARDYRGSVRGCTGEPCRVVRIRLERPTSSFPVSGTVIFERIDQGTQGRFSEVSPGSFGVAGRWRSLNRGDYAPPDSLLPSGAALRFDVAAPTSSTIGIAPVDTPVPLPGIVTRELQEQDDGDRLVELTGLDRSPVSVEAIATAEVVPRGGRTAALVDLEYLQRQSTSSFTVSRREVWVAPGAPPDLVHRLAEGGVRVVGERRAADREDVLARQAPSLALLLFLVGAGIAALLAAGGTVVDVYLLGRRRSYELAAMLAMGVRRRSLLAGVLVEQAVLIGTGTLLGVATGYLGARLALPSVPLYTDTSTFPPPLFTPDGRLLTLVVAAVGAAMGVAVLAAALLLVRAAVPSRLREVQA